MTLTLPPEIEHRLDLEAKRQGVPAETVALMTLDRHLPGPDRRAAAIATLEQWSQEDLDDGDLESDEFFKAIDEHRPSYRKLYPPELKGITW